MATTTDDNTKKKKRLKPKKPLTRSRFTILVTVYFFVALIIPNCVLAITEPYSGWTVEALILLPLGFYMMWSVLLKRSGIMIWLGFAFIFFCAFQLVLLYLFGNSIIATDMFTNLLTTNPRRGLRTAQQHLSRGHHRLPHLHSAAVARRP